MSTHTLKDHLVPRYQTLLNTESDEYKDNLAEWKTLIDQLQQRLKQATSEGKSKHLALHKKRGQLSGTYFRTNLKTRLTRVTKKKKKKKARERIELLLDQDSPFLELCTFAGYGQEDMTLGKMKTPFFFFFFF